jgi:hypothetical protein
LKKKKKTKKRKQETERTCCSDINLEDGNMNVDGQCFLVKWEEGESRTA